MFYRLSMSTPFWIDMKNRTQTNPSPVSGFDNYMNSKPGHRIWLRSAFLYKFDTIVFFAIFVFRLPKSSVGYGAFFTQHFIQK